MHCIPALALFAVVGSSSNLAARELANLSKQRSSVRPKVTSECKHRLSNAHVELWGAPACHTTTHSTKVSSRYSHRGCRAATRRCTASRLVAEQKDYIHVPDHDVNQQGQWVQEVNEIDCRRIKNAEEPHVGELEEVVRVVVFKAVRCQVRFVTFVEEM